MSDLEQYRKIWSILSDTTITSTEARAGYLAHALAQGIPSPALVRACQTFLISYSEVAMNLPHHYGASVEHMYDKSRRELASALMHLVSPTWE